MSTILLVDDEISILKSIQRIFMDDPTITVLTASSAREASTLLAANTVDLVISDERMPGVSGTDFLHYARDHYPSIPRIILTGYASQEATIKAINQAEVFRFLTKPWDPAELVATVKHALEIKNLRDSNEKLSQKVQAQNQELAQINASLEHTVAERTTQLTKALEALRSQNEALQGQRTGVVELLISMIGTYEREKSRIARQTWEALRAFADATTMTLSSELPFAAMLKVFIDPVFTKGDDSYLKLLASIKGFGPIAALIAESDENFDGSGPAKATGPAISPEARLLRIALDFYTLNPSNHALSRNYIFNHLGELYDPDIAKAFLEKSQAEFSTANTFSVEVDNLLIGMVAAKDILLVNGAILLPAETKLNATMITQLKKLHKLIKDHIEVYASLEKDDTKVNYQ